MSNIEPNIIDPTGIPPSPDVIVPEIDPEDGGVGDDSIREPDGDHPAIEPDPEEANRGLPPIRRADTTHS
ncbi:MULTISPECIES: hypothetical protein [unclassified Aureimonas]|jgi:hypothetical protein|uniref:hypothetical protein n=1 Tax=unclassified Aureimonas TaxID=2615206 RepID=UPI0006F6F118|nr:MULTISPECIES: hypothetical protein [unclassified Aureimonas]KQT60268.1 hypothetical protein ASG62_06240 [Aureimonas sp. Leaf427]KQT79143.1 hypothetical protein ASG54_08830 [Aureimonas sp. Leaf460]